MADTLQMLGMTCFFISLFCYGFVVYKMFTEGGTVLAIVCVASLLCGVGAILAFVYGWIKVTEWELKPVMLTWTGIWVLSFILNVLAVVLA